MICKRHRSPEEIELLVATIDRHRAEGTLSVDAVCKNLGVPPSTYYGWKEGKGRLRPAPSATRVLKAIKNPFAPHQVLVSMDLS
jgi:transposase-like protein